jgi:hypothetical protein
MDAWRTEEHEGLRVAKSLPLLERDRELEAIDAAVGGVTRRGSLVYFEVSWPRA